MGQPSACGDSRLRAISAGLSKYKEAGQVRRKRDRDRSDIAKSGDFSVCPYCQ